MRFLGIPLRIAVVALLLAGAVHSQSDRPITLLAGCDTGDLTAAKLGRERLLQAAGLNSSSFVVVTGGALSAVGRPSQQADQFPLALLELAGVDVVNLAHRDCARMSATVKGSKVPCISATFRRPEWPAHVVLERGGSKVAFIGAAVRSASVELAGKVEGLQYVEPVPAIRVAIAEVRGKAERIVLLADAPPTEVARWMRECAGIDLAIVSARGGVPVTLPGLHAAAVGGRAWTVVEDRTPSRQILIAKPSEASAEYAKYAKQSGVHESGVELSEPKATTAESVALAELAPGRAVSTSIRASNRAATLGIRSVALLDSYGGIAAPDGGRFLVIDTSWQNILTPELLRGQLFPVAYQVKPLSNHLYCVADGHVSLRHSSAGGIEGVLPWDGLSLPLPGSEARGKLLFEVPKGVAPSDLDLRFYDYAHGPMFVPLVRKAEPEREQPAVPLQSNEVLEAEIHRVERKDARAGKDLLTLEFRARSTVVMDADATAYDPKAKPGTRIEVGTVADWKDWRRHTQLVVDGEFAYRPLEESTLPEIPRFLPDVVTGDTLAFLVPKSAKSVELLCGMPNARLPGSGKVIRPEPFRFLLNGKVGALPERKAILSIEDDVFRVAVTEQRTAHEIGSESAGEGNRFLILAVTVANAGSKGETFQTSQQLRVAGTDGKQYSVDDASGQGQRPPIELLWIPKGDRRSFEVAYRLRAGETKPRLAYRGFSFAKEYDLPPLEGGAPAGKKPAAPPPPPPVKPVETPKPPPPVKPVEAPKPPTAKPITPPAGVAKLEGGALAGFSPAAVTGKDVELQVLDARLVDTARKTKANKGTKLLVLQLVWKRTGAIEMFDSLRLDQSLRLRSEGRFLQPPWGSSYAKKEGFLPGYFRLDEKQPDITAKAVFEIPEQVPARLSLVHAANQDNVLVVPLRAEGPAPEPLPEIARVENEAITIAVHEIVDPGEEVRERITKAGYMPESKRLVGLRVSVFTKDKPRDLGYINQRWRLISGGDFPVPPFFVKRYGPVGGWPAWHDRRTVVPGVPDHGLLLFALPDPNHSLEFEFDLNNLGLKGGAKLADARPRLLLRKGTKRAKTKPLAALTGKEWRLELLGCRANTMRNYLLVALDFRVRAPVRENFWYFGPSDLLVIDQTGRRQSPCSEDDLAYETPRKFTLAPGDERRFTTRFFLRDRGSHLWLRLPGDCPDKMVRVPNPWVESDLRRLAPEGELKVLPYKEKQKFEFTPPPLFPEPEPKGIESVGLTGQQVNEAIRKGAAYLAQRHERGFPHSGDKIALVILAMLHSGELPKYPELEASAIECLQMRKFRSSYDLALTAMGLAHVDPQRYQPRIREIAQAFVDAQQKKGGWGYMSEFVDKIKPRESAAASKPAEESPEPADRVVVEDAGPIPDWPGTDKSESIELERTTPLKDGYCDNSCSQYAILGLLAASHAGVMAPKETWERAASRYEEAQDPLRGWGYRGRNESTGAMTTAGLAGFAVVRHQLGGLSPEREIILRTGLDWLARNYRLDDNPNSPGSWHYYYLYGLERAGRLLAKDFIGDHEWYAEGARFLVDSQRGDGSWKVKGSNELLDTSFAILFLTRATEKLGEKKAPPTGPGWLEVEARSASGALVFILDASASMMADLGSETRFDAARRVVLDVLQGSGTGLEVALRAYGHRYRSNKKEANTDSELIVGFGSPDRAEFSAKLGKMRCRGKTPLTYSVQEAIKDLEGAQSKDRRVLLLTDGMESNRRAKPLEAAAAIKAAGARLDVVCLCMDSTDLLEKMAAAGGGACYSAADAEQLLAALKTAVVGDVAFRVLGADGQQVAQGKSGDKLELPAGPYTVEVALPGGAQQIKAWIHQDRTTKLRIR